MNPQRNHVIDVARAASILVVVLYHGLLYKITLTPDGALSIEPWAAPTWLYPLSWFIMIMPLFFVAGGFGHALTWDRMRAEGARYADFLGSRARRLVGPVLLFVTVSAAISTIGALAAGVDVAAPLSQRFMILLWFLAVYLVIIALAPAMVRLHDRIGLWAVVPLLLASLVIDWFALDRGQLDLLNGNYVLVWLAVHQLGIAYQRGWFRTGPAWMPWTALLAGAAGVAALIFVAGYPPSSVAFADLPVANTQPPTSAMIVLAVAQCGVLGLVERSHLLQRLSASATRRLALVNALMLTTYLWHLLAIVLAGGLLVGLTWALPALAPVTLNQLTVAGAGLLMTTLLVPLIGRVELRLVPPFAEPVRSGEVIVAFTTLLTGVMAVWMWGTVVLPSTPASLVAVALTWLGCALMRRAVAPRRPPRDRGRIATQPSR